MGKAADHEPEQPLGFIRGFPGVHSQALEDLNHNLQEVIATLLSSQSVRHLPKNKQIRIP